LPARRLFGVIGKLFVDFLFATSKIKVIGQNKVNELLLRKNVFMASWHSRILLSCYALKGRNVMALVSKSGDG